MPASTTAQPTLGPHEQALAQYRTISRMALLALGLGLASPLALVSLLLSSIPLVAIALAVISLRSIQSSGGQLIGRVPAVASLCMATFFLGWGVSQRYNRELALEGHARQFAEAWLTLVAHGELQPAHQLRTNTHSRIVSAKARREFYEKNPEALADLNAFFATPGLKEFVAQGAGVKFQFDSPAGRERFSSSDTLELKFTYHTSAGATRPLWITVKRQKEEDHVDWEIQNATGESNSDS